MLTAPSLYTYGQPSTRTVSPLRYRPPPLLLVEVVAFLWDQAGECPEREEMPIMPLEGGVSLLMSSTLLFQRLCVCGGGGGIVIAGVVLGQVLFKLKLQ